MKPNKSGPFIIMKTLKSSAADFTNLISKSIKDFRDSYTAEVNEIKTDLLRKISEDYGISFEELAFKYIKKNKIFNKQECDFDPSAIIIDTYGDNSDDPSEELFHLKDATSESESRDVNKNLLHKITIEKDAYYVENKENGNVYDVNSNVVGLYKHNHVELDVDLAKKYRIERKNAEYGAYVQQFIHEYETKMQQLFIVA